MAAELELKLPGFRFHPTEEELLEFYLKQVVHGNKLKFDIIPTVHLYRHHPRELPGLARIGGEREWYFFVPRDRKQAAGGGRPSRTTERGFWKATGSDRAVRCAADPRRLIGLKKTLVYYEGRAPRGTKTDWVMNEYRFPDADDLPKPNLEKEKEEKEDMVLCKVYRKAVSLKELEQRVAMEELARSSLSQSHSAASISSSDFDGHHAGDDRMHITSGGGGMNREAAEETEAAAAVRPATLCLPQLEVARHGVGVAGGLEWTQDPFLTQLRSPWMESWSPFYPSVLNF